MELKKFVSYEDFGAVGNGKHDDFDAIIAAHQYANENGLPVIANDSAVYYIGGANKTAVIKTDVDFGKAHFIFDDVKLENIKANVFSIPSLYANTPIEIKELHPGQKKIDFPHEGKAYVRVFDDNHKMFIRYGVNENSGSATSDAFIVDADGNIEIDIDWDYPTVTRAYARRLEDTPLTVRGGIFTTIANQAESFYNYHSRGFTTNRANVTFEGMTHLVTGELDHGAPYAGFICSNEAVNTTIRNCVFTPHFIYKTMLPGGVSHMGTYEISLGGSIGTVLDGVTQTIDIMDNRYWGLMGSNYSKDFTMKDCVVSRFDAHCGVTNGKILRSKLGHQCLNLIGHGLFEIEDTEAFGGAFVNLRPDYGSSFDGKVVIKNCVWKPRWNSDFASFYADNNGMHDFGYTSKMPCEIEIDGLLVKDADIPEDKKFYILPNYDRSFEKGKPAAYVPTKLLKLKNIKTESGRTYEIAENPEEYEGLKVIEEA